MAFGTWIKRIGTNIANFAKKNGPKILQFASDYVAPAIEKLGGTVGGTAGTILGGVGKGIRAVNDRVQSWNATGKDKFLQPAYDKEPGD